MSKNWMSGLFGAGAAFAVLLVGADPAQAQEHEHEHAGLTITAPADGATVTGPVTIAFAAGEGGGHHGHGGGGRQVFVLIDQSEPEPGAAIQADPNHIAVPEGANQMTVTLAPGKHSLQLAVLDREGRIGRHFHPAQPVSVTVQ